MAMIDVWIEIDGTILVEVDGVVGEGCEELTRRLVEGLGKQISIHQKPEHFVILDKTEAHIYEE